MNDKFVKATFCLPWALNLNSNEIIIKRFKEFILDSTGNRAYDIDIYVCDIID